MTQSPVVQMAKDNDCALDNTSPEVECRGMFPDLDVLSLLSERTRERYIAWRAKQAIEAKSLKA